MIVFVHGVPETAALCDNVRSHLDGESVAVSLPGFGCERPDGFGATKDEYVTWLVAELGRFDEPAGRRPATAAGRPSRPSHNR